MYAKGKYISSFIGFVPDENPEIVIIVVIDEPQGKYYGGIVAAPAFRKIAQESLSYMNISPRSSEEKLLVSASETRTE